MGVLKRARCPTCHESVATRPDLRPADFPVCSQRCRLLDLGTWLRGDYRIPAGQTAPPPEEP